MVSASEYAQPLALKIHLCMAITRRTDISHRCWSARLSHSSWWLLRAGFHTRMLPLIVAIAQSHGDVLRPLS